MKIKLDISGVSDNDITVLDYTYESEISNPYRCEVSFLSSKRSLNSDDFMYQESTLEVSFDDEGSANNIYGIVTEFYQLDEIGDSYEYKIIIEPEIVKLKNQKATNVFLNMSIDEIVKECFKKVGLKNYKIYLSDPKAQVVTEKYTKREFVFQYQETYFDFISRWLEYEGIYYYYDYEATNKDGKKSNFLILTDQSNSAKFVSSKNEGTLFYDKNALISNNASTRNYVMSFFAYTSTVPKTLTLNGYDYENDSQTMSQTKQISSTGLGDVTIFDENAIDNNSIERIINIRCQGMACMEHVFMGSTNLSNMKVGRYFKLTNHFRKDYNNSYFITAVSQTFSQRALFLSKFSNENEKDDDMQLVTTDFKAIPLKTQYRPQLLTHVKKIDGVIPAVVDSETDNDTPYLDDQGRYKIKFLHSDDDPGKGSGWIRKIESFLGNKYGTSIPLHKDLEVSIGFEYGNPDKPIIIGAMQNSSNENPVTSENSDQGYAFKSAQGNYVEFSDEEDKEYVKIYSPFGNSFYTVGYTDLDKYWSSDFGWIWSPMPEGSPNPEEVANLDYSDKAGVTIAGSNYEQILGDSFSVIHGDSYTATMGGIDMDLSLGAGSNSYTIVGENTEGTITGINIDFNVTGASFELVKTLASYTFFETPDREIEASGNYSVNVGGNYNVKVDGDIIFTSGGVSMIKSKSSQAFVSNRSSKIFAPKILFQNMMSDETILPNTPGVFINDEYIALSIGGTNSLVITEDAIVLKSGISSIRLTDEEIIAAPNFQYQEIPDPEATSIVAGALKAMGAFLTKSKAEMAAEAAAKAAEAAEAAEAAAAKAREEESSRLRMQYYSRLARS
ncbi:MULTISPECIES: type VI secretion system Vgr family protein [unclassified Francisella]|uniref:type VI secretion system Vgr family protein n=1 Tax=unclassified Francisella TaxID=2610885 RepID=UPI002E34CAB6|nr:MULTISPECIES: type VI secretion system tip protein TssI/VgrG [unclassified Francisella]MED7818338.1 type VI secretion system tip protein TssI/VgrG [Francisella sp. 19S2-4]MED7829174.1 type VI secretion system tip protein TssI/VgrG [Francisella sp. 19S2-10]